MYLYLDDSLASIEYAKDDDACIAIQNIFHAASAGYHVVSGSLVTLKAMRNACGLSSKNYAFIEKLINWHPQQASYFRKLSYGIAISANESSVTPLNDARKWWRVPLKYFMSFDVLSSTVLLAENRNDCELYCHAANQYKKRERISGVSVQVFPIGGGGSTTEGQFRDIADRRNSFCICITDSDKFSPASAKGKTATTCDEIMRLAEWPIYHVSTTGRELENDIPHSFYWESLAGEPRLRWEAINRTVNALNKIQALNFFDLKEGVSVWWIVSHNKTPAAYKFWSDLLIHLTLPDQPSRCLQRKTCIYEKKKDELCSECLIFPPVSKNIADDVKGWLGQRSTHDAIQVVRRDDMTIRNWLRIGQEVFECCLAFEKQRA